MENKEFIWSAELKTEFFEFAYRQSQDLPLAIIFQRFRESKLRKPIFTTNGDNVPIYEGERYWFVDTLWRLDNDACYAGSGKNTENTYFSTEAAANEYVKENKPRFSEKEIREIINDSTLFSGVKLLFFQKLGI